MGLNSVLGQSSSLSLSSSSSCPVVVLSYVRGGGGGWLGLCGIVSIYILAGLSLWMDE